MTTTGHPAGLATRLEYGRRLGTTDSPVRWSPEACQMTGDRPEQGEPVGAWTTAHRERLISPAFDPQDLQDTR